MKWPGGITGVVHAGAHLAEEFTAYAAHGVTHTLWIEPQLTCADAIVKQYGRLPGVDVWATALGSSCRTGMLRLATNGQSSSLLPPSGHLSAHPTVAFVGQAEVNIRTLDSWRGRMDHYQLLVLDLQGYELEALKGAERTLRSLSWVCSEVARTELYRGQVLVDELKAWMAARNWELVSEEWWPGSDEGECVWRRNS